MVLEILQEIVAPGADRVVITDGAWGTQLQARGLEPGTIPDLWNLTHPRRVESVVRAYVEAGSQVVLTNTFRANRIALARTAAVDRVRELNRAGVEISKRAAGPNTRVFASMGPSGKLLGMRTVTVAELEEAFTEQACALAEADPDAIVIETMIDLDEARIALEAARTTGKPVIACMVFDAGKNRDRTMTGVTPEQAAETLTAAGADGIGANCGSGIRDFVPVCARLAQSTEKPIWIKPNAGLPEIVDGEPFYRTTPDEFAQQAIDLRRAGARFIGGCCGTNPQFIAALKARLQESAVG